MLYQQKFATKWCSCDQLRKLLVQVRPVGRMSLEPCNAEFTLQDFSPDFHSLTGFAKSPTNAWNGGKLVLVHASDIHAVFNYQRRDLRESLMCCRHPWNILHAKYLDRFKSLLFEMSSDWKIHRRWPTANERARYRAVGSSERSHRPQYQWSCVITLSLLVCVWLWNVVCGPDRVVSDSFYCKVMQCVTSCRRSIVQCKHSSSWKLPQIVVQCENNGDPTTLKIVQCELGIRWKKQLRQTGY